MSVFNNMLVNVRSRRFLSLKRCANTSATIRKWRIRFRRTS